MNYLFIDDNKVQSMILKKALGQFCSAHEIRILNNPMEAIDLIRSRIFLPEMKFSDDWYSYIPIVVSTTVECVETAMECYGSGAAGYMIKPTDYKELTNILRVLIQYWEANLNPVYTSISSC